MSDWETIADGQKIDITKYRQYRKFTTIDERDAASVGFGSGELFWECEVVETGYKYYWNGAAWARFPGAGGAGAPPTCSYITLRPEGELSGETPHANITDSIYLHEPKEHHATHEDGGGLGEINVAGLSGLLADEQNAGQIKAKAVDAPVAGDNLKFLQYNHGASKYQHASVGGGGDMLKADYDNVPPGGNGIVDNSEKLEGSTKAQVQDHTPKVHKDSHKPLGDDAFTDADSLDAIAKTTVRKNTGANVGSRRRLNFIAGTGITLTITDDPGNEEVDINITSIGGWREMFFFVKSGSSPITFAHGMGNTPTGVVATVKAVQPYRAVANWDATNISIRHDAAGSLTVSVIAWL